MKKLLNNPWVVGLLVAAAIVFVARAALGPDQPAVSGTGAYPDDPVEDFTDDFSNEPAAAAGDGISSVRQALAALAAATPAADPFSRRDTAGPGFATDEEPPGETESIHLSAIWLQGPQTLLLVNNRIHAAGDVIGELTIESATIDGIWLSHPDGRDFVAVGHRFQRIATGSSRDPDPTFSFYEN